MSAYRAGVPKVISGPDLKGIVTAIFNMLLDKSL